MTVIMAAAFRDGMAIAADTLLHDPTTMVHVQSSAKTMLVGGRVGIAQAGTFNGTGIVWQELEKMDATTVTPKVVADLIFERASKIYNEKVANGGQLAIRYLVAGYNSAGVQEIHALEIDCRARRCFAGEGRIAALGTLPNAHDIATKAVIPSLKPGSNTFKVDEWVQRIVAAEKANSPQTVGFPATLLLIKPTQVIEGQIEEGQAHDPLLEGFFA